MKCLFIPSTVIVKGRVPKELKTARVRLTLERPLDSIPLGIEELPAGRPENRKERERIALENNRRASDPVLNRSEITVARAEFSAELETPSTMPWSNVVVRAWAFSDADAATGIRVLPVRRSD